MLRTLSDLGLKSEHLYAAGLASVGLSFVSWMVSKIAAGESKPQADRWGLFVGEWAPTFLALGTALKLEENDAQRNGRIGDDS